MVRQWGSCACGGRNQCCEGLGLELLVLLGGHIAYFSVHCQILYELQLLGFSSLEVLWHEQREAFACQPPYCFARLHMQCTANEDEGGVCGEEAYFALP